MARSERREFYLHAAAEDAARCSEISHIRSADELRGILSQPDAKWLVIENSDSAVVGIVQIWPWSKASVVRTA